MTPAGRTTFAAVAEPSRVVLHAVHHLCDQPGPRLADEAWAMDPGTAAALGRDLMAAAAEAVMKGPVQ